MEWIAYCTVCGEISRGPNGSWEEAEARVHRKNTGHTTIVGYEPTIIMSGEMVGVGIGPESTRGWKADIMLSPSELDVLSDDSIAEQFEQVTLPRLLKGIGVTSTGIGKWGDSLHIEATGYKPSDDTLKLTVAQAVRFAEAESGSHWEHRLFPTTYGDWVTLAEDIKTADPSLIYRVNYNLGLIQRELPGADDAKRWLTRKAGELNIS